MSSSYLDLTDLRCTVLRAFLFLGLATSSMGTALAADTYVQPQAELRVETNDNFNFSPSGTSNSNIYGYIADLQALIGIATPRSDTSIRPRVKFQEFPDRNLERIEAFFDLRSEYRWQRSRLLMLGQYSRQDTYNAETPSGEYDPLDPGNPGNPDSGTIVIGETRNKYQIRPEFTFDLTERTKVGMAAAYQAVRYESNAVQAHVDYNFLEGNGFVSFALDPRSDFTVGAYANKFETTDNSTETDAYGGQLGYQYRWSEVIGIEMDVLYEQDDTTDFLPVPVKDSSSGWGGTVSAYRKGEVSALRLSIGRTFIATGANGKAESDQVRLQYDRDLTQRLKFRGTGRYESRNSISTGGQGDDRDYARADLSLNWMMSTTWYLEGGYSYIWQDRQTAAGVAANNKLFVGVGYKGLERQRR